MSRPSTILNSSLEIAQYIYNHCYEKSHHTIKIGIIDNWGFYGFVCFAYPNTQYGHVSIFSWSSGITSWTLNEGKWRQQQSW